jgi:hypothetical protein
MKNGHIDSFQPIRAIPFVFSTNSFFAGGFSTLRCPEGTGQAERHNLTTWSVRAGARPILAYKLKCGLPRDFPVAGYFGAPTDSLKGWREREDKSRTAPTPISAKIRLDRVAPNGADRK